MLQILLKRDTNTWDISDFVINCEDIPTICRNHDFSLVADDIRIKVSELFTATTIADDDLIIIRDFYQDNPFTPKPDAYFVGFVVFTNPDKENHSIQVDRKSVV